MRERERDRERQREKERDRERQRETENRVVCRRGRAIITERDRNDNQPAMRWV